MDQLTTLEITLMVLLLFQPFIYSFCKRLYKTIKRKISAWWMERHTFTVYVSNYPIPATRWFRDVDSALEYSKKYCPHNWHLRILSLPGIYDGFTLTNMNPENDPNRFKSITIAGTSEDRLPVFGPVTTDAKGFKTLNNVEVKAYGKEACITVISDDDDGKNFH